METERHTLGSFIRDRRLRAGLNQNELAAHAALSERSLRDLEADRVSRPRAASLRRLAEALDITSAELDTLLATVRTAPVEPLRIGVLGSLSVRAGDAAVDVRSGMQRRLLGLLALRPGQPVHRQEIIDTLWGEQPPKSCLRLVQRYVGSLRKLLARTRAQGSAISLGSGGYVLSPAAGDHDVLRFGDLVARARLTRDEGRLAAAAELFDAALRCWRGPVLAGEDPLLAQHPAAVALNHERIAAALAFADLASDSGDHEGAAARLRELVADEPLHEALHARLVLAMAASGDQASALRLFAAVRNRLRDELGVEPGPELAAAHLRVLRQESPSRTASDTGEPGAPGQAGGSHAEPSAGEAGRVIPAQLPMDVRGFAGRAAELARLDGLVTASAEQPTAVTIMAISGTAGVGKTTLAVHWAHRVRSRFPDGQLYLDLRGHSRQPPLRAAEALAALLRALDTPPERIPADTSQAAARYRSLLDDRRMLLLLDDAASAEQVRPLLPAAPGCLVLVTSRDRLSGLVAREGARRITLDVLPPREARDLLASVLGRDRIDAEPEDAARLADLCGRLPLALRVSAAHLADRPARGIAGYADDLARGSRLAALEIEDDPETAVRTALDRSYAALRPDARRAYRLLGLVPGADFSPQAAVAAMGVAGGEAERLLERLAGRHLLKERAPGRFAFHDLVRLHARARAGAEDGPAEQAAVVRRVCRWHLSMVEAAAGLLYSHMLRLSPLGEATTAFRDARDARRWLDAESANLVAATAEAAAGAAREESWHLALALRGYFWMSGDLPAAEATATAALTAARAAGDARGQAAARLALGQTLMRLGRLGEARMHLDEAVRVGSLLDWPEHWTATCTTLGTLHSWHGRLDDAAAHYRRGLELSMARGHADGAAVNLVNLAFTALHAGDLEQAVSYGEQVLTCYGVAGSGDGHPVTLAVTGDAYHLLGRFDEALAYFDRALEAYRGIGSSVEESVVRATRVALHCDAGRYDHALREAEAVAHATRESDGRVRASALAALGTVHRHLGNPSAIRHLQNALTALESGGDRVLETQIRLEQAATHLSAGRLAAAEAGAEQAMAVARHAGYRVWEGQGLLVLAAVDLARGRPDRAAERATCALALHRRSGYRLGQARALLLIADTDARSAGSDASRAEAERILAEIGAVSTRVDRRG
ncbi:BTAD domain-containing putative transcriptional regulator [Nonomuraea indica]|uniref:BTAD domain-containing putative transcriptional regulator n=1 Tax=Nonomuraea indica TaxID=1581193 RepID=UPI000C7D8613|nr:BTAD domain-containing putative transcriptional regulator [Nonomuraea indica]